MNEQRNFIMAIALSVLVLVGWQIFFGIPQMEEQRTREAAQQQAQQTLEQTAGAPAAPAISTAPSVEGIPTPSVGDAPSIPGVVQSSEATRDAALTSSRRIAIETTSITGSIALTGARIDDLKLNDYHETVDPTSPKITVLSPTGSAAPFYVEHGWTAAPNAAISLPTSSTVWTLEGGDRLTADNPVTLSWDNGAGQVFRRTIAVDDRFMFSVTQSVENTSGNDIVLYPYALISRHGEPDLLNFFILHEGLIGVMGEEGLQEIDYDDVAEGETLTFNATGGWLGFTDKYWATVIAPAQDRGFKARFTATGTRPIFQTDFLGDPVTIAAGTTGQTISSVFSGAKQVSDIDGYEASLGLLNFELLIDWGWFYFITKPLFYVLDWLFGMIGNFGLAILALTVLIKLVFFPLANKSYVSMSKMKLLQPDMVKLRERYKDDRMKQQQELMALYKKEKVNPMSGCLPIVVQIPVFFALYKVLFVTIEMRHQPFFGWIRDLSAPDPTSLFNLFGIIPWDPPSFLMIGVWPLIMGFTMFIQMRLNPAPPDPIQQQIFTWMPVLFTFLLAQFAAGLVIYWAWNNTLSILQQYVIMRRQGVKVELWGNIMQAFRPKKQAEQKTD